MQWYKIVPGILQTLAWGPTRLAFNYFAKFEVHGLENLENLSQAIFAANHESEMDPIVVTAALSPFSRFAPMFYVTSPPHVFSRKIFGWRRFIYKPIFFHSWGAYQFTEGLRDYAKSLLDHKKIIQDGNSMLLFPGGGRRKSREEKPRARGGISYLADATGVLVVPTSLSGLRGITLRSFFAGQRRIIVRFGKPVRHEKSPPDSVENYSKFSEEIMRNIYAETHGVIGVHEHEDHEKNSLLKWLLHYLIITPILNSIPANFRGFLRKTHTSAEKVIDHRTKHQALEVLYAGGSPNPNSPLWQKLFHKIWFSTRNARAVRNRLLIVKKELYKEMLQRSIFSDKLNILSIASGSARAVIEAAILARVPEEKVEKISFLDKDPLALAYSQTLAEKLSFPYKAEWIQSTANSFLDNSSRAYDIIEMVGLMDYFDDEKAGQTFQNIYRNLKSGGCLITANIMPNPEVRFVSKALGWQMIYRTPEQLANLLREAGFHGQNLETHLEPLGVHCVIIARK